MKMADRLCQKELQNVNHSDKPTTRGCESLHLYWENLRDLQIQKHTGPAVWEECTTPPGKGKLW